MERRRRAETRDGMVVTTVALRESVLRRLTLIAARERTVMTELVRQAVDQWLARRGRSGRGKPNREGAWAGTRRSRTRPPSSRS